MIDNLEANAVAKRRLRVGMLLSLAVFLAAAAGIANSVLYGQASQVAVAPKERALS